MNDQQMRPVYVWEIPVRFTHWIIFLSILILSVTGFYIGYPLIHANSADYYLMGWMRFIHFVAAYVFLMCIAIRIYWVFVGNKYSNWRGFNPFNRNYWKNFAGALKFYLFISRKSPHTLGHPPLASFSYLLLYLLFVFEVISGFALYSLSHGAAGGIWTFMGGWLQNFMSLAYIRLVHHLVMYVILAFAILHVYICWLIGGVEKNGLMGSMFNGYKYISTKESEQ
jgi:Ni/Fe-hydrogenase 1 B-type cytochrome subunit